VELLRVASEERDHWTVVTASGQLDVATAPSFRQDLIEAQYGGATQVVLDLTDVEFLDSFGIGVLVGAARRARTHGGAFVVVCGHERTRHVLEVAGVADLLGVRPSLDAVLGADAG
jgi:anti-sigma B factor antagonist